jgi:hypothetical protein
VNAAGNLWNLSQVRKALGISPYNRSYYALLIPAAVTVAAVISLRRLIPSLAHPWLGILLALVVSYAIFCAFAVAFALNPDDRMIAQSAWSQLRSGMQKWGVSA